MIECRSLTVDIVPVGDMSNPALVFGVCSSSRDRHREHYGRHVPRHPN